MLKINWHRVYGAIQGKILYLLLSTAFVYSMSWKNIFSVD